MIAAAAGMLGDAHVAQEAVAHIRRINPGFSLAPEFDRSLGAAGLHRVSGPVRHEVRQTLLPPDLFERFDQLTFWNDPRGTATWRIAPEAPTTRTAERGRPEGEPVAATSPATGPRRQVNRQRTLGTSEAARQLSQEIGCLGGRASEQ
jgi:hypothetical protein